MNEQNATTQALALIGALERAGAVTATSLTITREISYEEYEALGRMLGRLHDASKFWIGDWIAYGEVRFGEIAAQAAAATGRAERTLVNWAWTCRNVPPSRRRDALSFSHHTVVAALEPAEQARYLDLAEEKTLTTRELEAAIEAEREPDDLIPWPGARLVEEHFDALRADLAEIGYVLAMAKLTVRLQDDFVHRVRWTP